MKMRLFRWKAIGFLLLVLCVLALGWLLFGDWLVKRGVESGGSGTLGTEVDVGWLKVRTAASAVEMGQLEVADPFDPEKDLFQAGHILVDLAPVPATEKKIVIDRMDLTGLRFGTTRLHRARPADKNGAAGQLLAQTRAWAKQFEVPLLSLTPIDTIKSLVMDPSQLKTVKAATAFAATTDSVRQAVESGLQSLALGPIVDSANALAVRLKGATPASLGLQGAMAAISSVKRTLDQLNSAKQQIAALQQRVGSGVDGLGAGLKNLDDARQQDYDFARGLLKLPSLDAPHIGSALFGQSSGGVFQQALYYVQLAQKYIPPGLQPWRRTGPTRLRMAGTTVQFPKAQAYPTFLLRQGTLSFSLGGDTTSSAFSASVTGLTTEPALYGKPATFAANGQIGAARPLGIRLAGLIDHIRKIPLDSVEATVDGVRIPALHLPGLPFSVEPGLGSVGFGFTLQGDRVAGRWELAARQAVWKTDTARAGKLGTVEDVLWHVMSGLSDLKIRAELGGTLSAPRLSVSSNLDAAVANRLKALMGEELAKGEARARAAVDRLVEDKVGAVKSKVATAQAELTQRLGDQTKRMDQVQSQLEAELRSLAGGLTLPKVKF